MKTLLLLMMSFVVVRSDAQVNTALLPEAKLFFEKAMKEAKPQIISLVQRKAIQLKGRDINADSLRRSLGGERILKQYNMEERDAVALLIMIQASHGADQELKQMVMDLAKNKKTQKSAFDKTAPIIARKSKIAGNVNTLIRKYNGSEQIVLERLK